jgi:hypothetical protein
MPLHLFVVGMGAGGSPNGFLENNQNLKRKYTTY